MSGRDSEEISGAQTRHRFRSRTPGIRKTPSGNPNMVSQAGTLSLQQYQDLNPVGDNPQEDSQCESTQIRRMHILSHDQAPMAHQGQTVKLHPNGKIIRIIRLGGINRVTASRVTSPNKGRQTKNIYRATTVFFEHFSHLRYVNLQINQTQE